MKGWGLHYDIIYLRKFYLMYFWSKYKNRRNNNLKKNYSTCTLEISKLKKITSQYYNSAMVLRPEATFSNYTFSMKQTILENGLMICEGLYVKLLVWREYDLKCP